MEWTVQEDRVSPGDWRVEAFDTEHEGECYVTIFSGPGACSRAGEYAQWKSSARAGGYTTWMCPHCGIPTSCTHDHIQCIASLRAQLAEAQRERDDALIAVNGERQARHNDPIVIRNLQARLAAKDEAMQRGILELEGMLRDGRVPRSCGACGTPDAACDGDCMSYSYICRDLQRMRTALTPDAPKEGKG